MHKNDLKQIIVGLALVILGGFVVYLDVTIFKSEMNLWINVGCSLIASGLVVLVTSLIAEKREFNQLDDWNISKIYATRAEKNADSDPRLEKARYQVDAIAFGLKTFRNQHSKKVEACLKKGVNFRIITMDPNSPFVQMREQEENESAGQIANTINQLIDWADNMNKKDLKGRVIVKGYSCMTLDFYWRVDDELYVGPYWYGYSSQQTITYKFVSEGKGFTQYTEYFEKLWENEDVLKPLTQEIQIKKRSVKKR